MKFLLTCIFKSRLLISIAHIYLALFSFKCFSSLSFIELKTKSRYRHSRYRHSISSFYQKFDLIKFEFTLFWRLLLKISEAVTWRFPVKNLFLEISQNSQEKETIKKRVQHRCFPVKFAKFLRTPTLKNICERLLVKTSTETKHQYFRPKLFSLNTSSRHLKRC